MFKKGNSQHENVERDIPEHRRAWEVLRILDPMTLVGECGHHETKGVVNEKNQTNLPGTGCVRPGGSCPRFGRPRWRRMPGHSARPLCPG